MVPPSERACTRCAVTRLNPAPTSALTRGETLQGAAPAGFVIASRSTRHASAPPEQEVLRHPRLRVGQERADELEAPARDAPDDVWAVGHIGRSLGQGVAVHWSGRRWTRVPVPQIDASPTQDVRLTSVTALAADDVWAAGVRYSYDDSTSEPIMLHFDGDEWTRTQLPVQTGDLTDLVRVGAQVWAVGSVALRYDGSGWQEVAAPAAGTHVAGTVLEDGRLLTAGSAAATSNTRSRRCTPTSARVPAPRSLSRTRWALQRRRRRVGQLGRA